MGAVHRSDVGGSKRSVCHIIWACLHIRKDLRYDRPHAKAVRLRVGSSERALQCNLGLVLELTLWRWGSGFVIVPKRLQTRVCVKCRTKVAWRWLAFFFCAAVYGRRNWSTDCTGLPKGSSPSGWAVMNSRLLLGHWADPIQQ